MHENPFVNPSEETVRAINERVQSGKAIPDVAQYRCYHRGIRIDTCEDQAMTIVFDYVYQRLDPSDAKHATFEIDEVYVVQFTYILGNWKALVSTSLPDGMYYEVTYDKRRGVAYLDAYKRFDHKEIAVPNAPR